MAVAPIHTARANHNIFRYRSGLGMTFVLNVRAGTGNPPFWLKRTNIDRVPRRNASPQPALASCVGLPRRGLARCPGPSADGSSEGRGFACLLAQLRAQLPSGHNWTAPN